MKLRLNNTRTCAIELREDAKGYYKGLIYCAEIGEAESVMKEAIEYIHHASNLKPIVRVKRGCTEFTNAYKKYGEIGDADNLHPGPQHSNEIDEKKFLGKEREQRD